MVYDPNGSDNKSLLSLVAGHDLVRRRRHRQARRHEGRHPGRDHGHPRHRGAGRDRFRGAGQGGAPPAKFQVLVEPDGTTGSYILFDKTTLTPIATVNQAGTQTIVNGQGAVSFLSSVQLSPDAQKIITDVFSLKFTDLNNPQYQAHDQLHRFDRSGNGVPQAGQRRLRPGDASVRQHAGQARRWPQHRARPPSSITFPGRRMAAASGGAFTERAETDRQRRRRHACPARSTMPTSTPATFRASKHAVFLLRLSRTRRTPTSPRR